MLPSNFPARLPKVSLWAAFVLAGLLVVSACSLAGEPIPSGPIHTPNPDQNLQPFGADELPTAELPSDVGFPVEFPDAAIGASLYNARCAACHGLDGSGNGDVSATLIEQGARLPDFTDMALMRQRSPQNLFRTITDGRIDALMPPWGQELTEAERWDLAYFLSSFSSTDETLALGRELFRESCVRCHSANGRGGGPEATEFVPDLTDATLMLARTPAELFNTVSLGVGKLMPPSDDFLSEDERWALVDYVRSFNYAPLPAIDQQQQPQVGALPPTSLPGTVSGTIFNRTTNSGLADQEVLLHGLVVSETDIVEIITLQMMTDAQGNYRFDGVPMDIENLVYVVDLAYAGIEFNNAAVIAPGETVSLDLPIDVYETTQDASAISVETLHLVISRQGPDSILVGQIYVYNNASQSAYVSDIALSETRSGTVMLPVPLDAFGLAFQDGELGNRFIQIGGNVLDTAVVLPGNQSHSVVMTYLLRYDGSYTLTLPMLYQTNLVNVISESDDIDVQVEGLREMPPDAELEDFDLLTGSGFAAGSQLTITLDSDSGGFSLTSGGGLILAVSVIVLAVAGSGLWVWRGRRADDDTADSSVAFADDRKRELMQTIANLDDDFEAGHIAKAQYEVQRARLKAELVTLLEDQNERDD